MTTNPKLITALICTFLFTLIMMCVLITYLNHLVEEAEQAELRKTLYASKMIECLYAGNPEHWCDRWITYK